MTILSKDAHGGNIYRMTTEAGIKGTSPGQDGILDFSASINPLGMPGPARKAIKLHLDMLGHYPDPDTTALRTAIAGRYLVDPERVIAANGSTELIYLIPRVMRPETVLVTAPTFSEFERAATVSGAKIKRLALKQPDGFRVDPARFIDAMRGADMAALCNPNNPTGRLLKKDDALEIAEAAKRMKCTLIVDEAFMDFCGQADGTNPGSVLGASHPCLADNTYLIVLRSLTKFYALAGLRLGFGYFPSAMTRRMLRLKEPWSVNTLSQAAGVAALGDMGYIKRTLALIQKERAYLSEALKGMDLSPYPSEVNYLLVRVPEASGLRAALMGHGIAVRDCGNFRGMGNTHIRVAVRSRAENERLIHALGRAMKEQPWR